MDEIKEIISGIMKGRTMFIGFYLFGPRKSPFTMHAVQVTDSAYVAHNENIPDTPSIFFEVLKEERKRLKESGR